jgi:serine/threonine protein kinase
LAPETFINKEQVTKSVDLWGLGSLIYEMVVGFPPFFQQNQSIIEMKEKIMHDEHKYLEFINSPSLRELLSQLLCKDPKKRLGFKNINEIKNHPWFANISWGKVYKKEISAPFIP